MPIEFITGLGAALASALAGVFALFFRGDKRFRASVDEILKDLPEPTTISLEDRQYALQREYHARGLAQSTQSFWFSIGAATVGFLVILSAVAFSLVGGQRGSDVAYIQIVAGLIIEAVSGLFFVQSNRARHLMAQFFDKLREDRKFEESLRLAKEGISGVYDAEVRAILALSFSGSVSPELVSDYAAYLRSGERPGRSSPARRAEASGEKRPRRSPSVRQMPANSETGAEATNEEPPVPEQGQYGVEDR